MKKGVTVITFNTTVNNVWFYFVAVSLIGDVLRENHQPATSYWQTLSSDEIQSILFFVILHKWKMDLYTKKIYNVLSNLRENQNWLKYYLDGY
jgi:hypothetical protein